MGNESEFECYACSRKTLHNQTNAHVPYGWKMIKLKGVARLFCDACAVHFHGHPGLENPNDISPHMKDVLNKKYGLKL